MVTGKYTDELYVAIWMVTYNHSKYIGRAIEGILNQKTSFRIKLFIGEDCSQDDTRAICQDYTNKYPDIINLICTKENNMWTNSNNIWKACSDSGAKYLAFCEGDDYWIDPHKLQKQVDFLESHPDFSITYSNVCIEDEKGNIMPHETFFPKMEKDELTIADLILSYTSVVPTASLVCKNILPYPFPDFYLNTRSGDIMLTLMLADKGKAKLFKEQMSVYRIHSGGITKSRENLEKGNELLMELYHNLNKYFEYRYNMLFRKRFLENARVMLIFGSKNKKGIKKIRHYFKTMPEYIRYSDKINFKELTYYHCILFFPFLLKLYK